MSNEGLRRPVTLAIACGASLTLVYLAWRNYQAANPSSPSSAPLHRSNAVRRPHRRNGPQQSSAYLEAALQAIDRSRTGQHTFGRYEDPHEEPGWEGQVSLDLRPSNLQALFSAISDRHPEWSPEFRNARNIILQITTIHNILEEFYPPGTALTDVDKNALVFALTDLEMDQFLISKVLDEWNEERQLENLQPTQQEQPQPEAPPHQDPQIDGANDGLEDEEADTGDQQPLSVEELNNHVGSQNMLNLLFNIAGEQAKRDGYIHRGIECNGCGQGPIHGIRYHCANCFDYDLCETCESRQVHIKTHVFYKIRIPAPSRGQIKQVIPKWYPGNPNLFPHSVPRPVMDRLVDDTGLDRTEIAALFEQFKCLASHEYTTDPCHFGMAIDRKGFDTYFLPGQLSRATPANLIYDRVFAFYDTNEDNLIGFDEFVTGLAKAHDKSRMARLRRIFDGYDLDGDGFVSRKDFLRMFRAYYDLSRQLNREMIHAQEDFGYLDEEIREVVQGSQPISAAFGGSTLFGHESRGGQDKTLGANGDLQISNGPNGVLQDDLDLRGDRYRAIGNAAIGNQSNPFRTFRSQPPQDEPLMHLRSQNGFELVGIHHGDDAPDEEINGPDPPIHPYGWPPLLPAEADDVIAALGADVPLEEITDPLDRTRVIVARSQRRDAESDTYQDWQRQQAAYERWKRRQFYLDQEEGYTRPQGYSESDSSDEETEQQHVDNATSRRQSLRSRSSSKVRFDDSAIDTDYETRSNASSRSVTQNERWGGYELGHPEFDVGRDILYEAVQQGLNELLDKLFKAKEDEAMEALKTRRDRIAWKELLDTYEASRQAVPEINEEAIQKADQLRTQELFAAAEASQTDKAREEQQGDDAAAVGNQEDADELLRAQFGDQIRNAIAAAVSDVQEASRFARGLSEKRSKSKSPAPDRDPTLPQFRPNSESTSPARIKVPDPPPSSETMDKWLKHRAQEEQAEDRGGPGKLSFNEFRIGMAAQDKNNGKREARQDENDPAYWEQSADLGKLAFLSSWLEMANF
jgi:hypothetical protein